MYLVSNFLAQVVTGCRYTAAGIVNRWHAVLETRQL